MTKYWLMKSEPGCYSIDDLERDKTEHWDGVRNYQARNFMRDEMKIGDKVLFYHSNAELTGVVGIAEVCKEAYPDFTAWDPKSDHPDPRSTPDNPVWMMVDVAFVQKLKTPIPLKSIKEHPELSQMLVAKKGQRLSIQPVEKKHFDLIQTLGS